MDPQQTEPPKKPIKPLMGEPSIRNDGTRLFRMMNFELFAVSTSVTAT